jgi:hypothetical protein
MTVYYTEYIAYQIYSNTPAVTAGAPQTVRLENKSKVKSDELTPPPQLQRHNGANAVTGVETDEYHMQMIALCSRGRGGRGRSRGEVRCSDIILTSRWIHRELLCPIEKRKEKKEKKNSWTKTGLRVRNGEGDRRSGASTACISPTVASAVARRPGGGGGQR